MIKKLSYAKDKNIKLSPHTSVYEIRSHFNGQLTTDEILIDTYLLDLIEELIIKINAKSVLYTSVYRNKECDIKVGGNGSGMHTKGKAADCIFKDANGKAIDPRYISCIAQDLGFGGIARISANAIHLDTRSGKRYLGDETKSLNTVTNDFYKYYGINKKDNELIESISKVSKEFGVDNAFWQMNYNTKLGLDCLPELFRKIAEKI